MEWNDLSFEGKRKLARWLRKQNRNHNLVCVSKIISGAKSESDLFKTCRTLGVKNKRKSSGKALGASQLSSKVQTPDLSPESST